MRILAYHPSHDGAAALIEDGRLTYSIESEKDVSVPAWPMAGPSREAEDALDIANTPQGCTGGADGRGTGAR
jgi:predicted NodU family carbamoyl transferase